jgi:HEPN domain-containing protein
MKREEVNRLLDRSRKFKDVSEFHLSRGDYDLAVFNVEQSLKLFLKAKLLEFGVDFPRVHSLRKLFLLLGQVLDKVEVFKVFEKRQIYRVCESRRRLYHIRIFSKRL